MLPEADDVAAQHSAERIRQAVAGTAFMLPDGAEINMTASIGVASYPGCAASAEE